jgi:hypothetical protein
MRFFLSIFIASLLFSAAAFGQSKNILADGNPPLTGAMVERLTALLEWSLDADFSSGERSELKNAVTAYWKNRDEKSIRSVLDMLAFEEKLAGAGEDQKRNLQPQVEREILKTIEKDSDEPLNRLLLAVYNRKKTSANDNESAARKSGPVGNLAGRWQTSHANSLSTQNVYTGAIGGGNGMVAEYDIKPDGRVIFSLFMTQNNYGCTTKIKTSKTGRVLVNGSQVTFTYEKGTTTGTDSCNAKYNYTKNLGPSSETFEYKLTRDGGRTQFCFANSKLKDCAVKLD